VSGRDGDATEPPRWVGILGEEWVRRHGATLFVRLVPAGAILTTGSMLWLMFIRGTVANGPPPVDPAAVESVIGVDPLLVGGAGLLAGLACVSVGYKLGTAVDELPNS
jgi:hypothetical protein